MKVLVACEESQEVCKAFRDLGHEAYSCDLKPCSGGHPEWYIQDDIMNVLRHGGEEWDLIIAHPYCTHTSVSGARWFAQKRKDGRQQEAIRFFMFFTTLKCEKVAIEHPISIMSSEYRKPDQIIQPYMFGHGETKATCLWLKGLPKLKPTDIVEGREQKIWKMPPSKDRAELRSKTYPGIAKAMAQQWGRK
jgi:site-specific DNA-cytosine methylase